MTHKNTSSKNTSSKKAISKNAISKNAISKNAKHSEVVSSLSTVNNSIPVDLIPPQLTDSQTEDLWRVIDGIYHAAEDLNAWPDLILSLMDCFIFSQDENQNKNAISQLLIPQIQKALRFNAELICSRQRDELAQHTIDQFALGILIVNSEGVLLAINTQAYTLLPYAPSSLLPGSTRIDLTPLIPEPDISPLSNQSHTQSKSSPQPKISLKNLHYDVIPLNSNTTDGARKQLKTYLILLKNADQEQRVDTTQMQSIYRLTPPEAEVLEALLDGQSLKEIAESNGKSRHTIKDQLNSIFRKTGTNRQVDLVRMFSVEFPIKIQSAKVSNSIASPITDHFIDIGHRQLCFADYGPKSGLPVILIHSSTGSRKEIPTDLYFLFKMNIRLIIPDRPGYGYSDYLPNRSLMDIATDIETVADHLAIETFHLVAFGSGGPYGLATSIQLPERVKKLALISWMPRVSDVLHSKTKASSMKLMLKVLSKAPSILSPIFNPTLMDNPNLLFDLALKKGIKHLFLTDYDTQYFKSDFYYTYLANLRESTRQGNRGWTQEVDLVIDEWPFSPADVTVECHSWHGANDPLFPPTVYENIKNELPISRQTILQNETRFMMFRQLPLIIETLITEH